MDIRDQAVIISGGASGMGAVLSESLAAAGALVIVLDKNGKQAESVANKTKGVALVCDITVAEDVEQAIQSLPTDLQSKVKANINCAGIAPAKRMVGKEGPVSLEWFESVVKVNLIGTFNVMRLCTNLMIKNSKPDSENGVLINTASIAAFDGQVGQSAYSASKAGVVGMTLPLARELAQFGIRVMTIAPGMINTPMMQGMPDKVSEHLLNQTIYPKRFGEPSEFAKLACHIIDNPMLNGEVIRLDGAVRMV
tara:strand:+ start:48770 stop:49525 length:756 start_codon:yes stop_codon:yes gene_type:complete